MFIAIFVCTRMPTVTLASSRSSAGSASTTAALTAPARAVSSTEAARVPDTSTDVVTTKPNGGAGGADGGGAGGVKGGAGGDGDGATGGAGGVHESTAELSPNAHATRRTRIL